MSSKQMPLRKDCTISAYARSRHTLIFSCSFLASKFSPSVKMSREAIEAIASWPIYSSKSSLPKSIAKIAAGSIIASLYQRKVSCKGQSAFFIHNMTRTRNPVVTKKTTFQPHYGLLSQRSVCFIIVSLHFLQVD